MDRLTPATKLVLRVLEKEVWMTQKEIVENTYLSERTVKYALRALKDEGFLHEKRKLGDLRRKYYQKHGQDLP